MALSETQKRKIEEEENYRAQVKAQTVSSNQNYGMPALLSFFVAGLGQIVKGEVGKGILIMVIQAVLFLLSFVVIGIIPFFILWVWQIADAYNHKVA